MKQLDCRKYSREEIAEILSIPVKDSHFARNVKQTLDKWGYKYNYARAAVTITDKPQTAQERLKELLIRKLKLDIQIDSYEFSCFLYELAKSDEFQSMPWGNRIDILLEKYDVSVSDRTLRNWCSHLIREEIVNKSCGGESLWKTEIIGDSKVRTPVTADNPERQKYFERWSELVEECTKEFLENGLSEQELGKIVWNATIKTLWSEFGCCYYSCKRLMLNAIDCTGEQYLQELYELTEEIISSEGN